MTLMQHRFSFSDKHSWDVGTLLWRTFKSVCTSLLFLTSCHVTETVADDETYTEDWPDIRSVEPDLIVPKMISAAPAAGRRVRSTTLGWRRSEERPADDQERSPVYHSLYLPPDWRAGEKYPLLVDLPGNGGYRDALGDECNGRPEGCSLGYGVSGGQNFIWLCLPFLNEAGTDVATLWWGDKNTFRAESTIKYWHATIEHVCHQWGGDSDQVILCGFSRGAIACNALGLQDDETAKLWKAFIICSHYDGVRSWPFPGSDKASASGRLQRLKDRPQFICGEKDQINSTRIFLAEILGQDEPKTLSDSRFSLAPTGFRNHNDQWTLRPSVARDRLRRWLENVLNE